MVAGIDQEKTQGSRTDSNTMKEKAEKTNMGTTSNTSKSASDTKPVNSALKGVSSSLLERVGTRYALEKRCG